MASADRISFDTVREIGLALPDTTEIRYYGHPALAVHGEMFVVRAADRSADRNSVSVMVGLGRREQLIAADPNVYYLTPHYEHYPVVLARLNKIDRKALESLLQTAHRVVAGGARLPSRQL